MFQLNCIYLVVVAVVLQMANVQCPLPLHSFHLSDEHRKLIASHKVVKSSPLFADHSIINVGPDIQSDFTVISIYFAFNKSKHGLDQYKTWTKNMMASVSEVPLVMFCDKASLPTFIETRAAALSAGQTPRTTFYVYDTVWSLLKELEMVRNNSYTDNYQNYQYTLEHEMYHTTNLYAVWNLKAYVVGRAARENKYNSKFFLFTDAGAFRSRTIPSWPNVDVVKQVAKKVGDYPLFGQVNFLVYNFPWDDLIEATWFAGTVKALTNYEKAYYTVHDERIDAGLFIGKEQALMNLVVFGTDHTRTKRYINSTRLKIWEIDVCYDKWFVYQLYFADDSYFNCGRDRLSLISEYDEFYTGNHFHYGKRK